MDTVSTRQDVDPYLIMGKYYDVFARTQQGVQTSPKIDAFVSCAPADSRVLDFGSGTGNLAMALAARGHQVVCIEPSETMRGIHLSKIAQDFALAPLITLLPLGAFAFDRTFDYVVCAGVLQHLGIDERRSLFTNVYRMLRPGGAFAMDMVVEHPDLDWPEQQVAAAQVGEVSYELRVESTLIGDLTARQSLTYTARTADCELSRETVTRVVWAALRTDVERELRDRNFTLSSQAGPAADFLCAFRSS